MIDKKARQKRLEKANKFLAYFDKVGYHHFYHPDWQRGQSKIVLVPIGDGYRSGCWLYDGRSGERVRILGWSYKLEDMIGHVQALIVVKLAAWIMKGGTVNHRFTAWGNMPDMVKKSVELGISK